MNCLHFIFVVVQLILNAESLLLYS